jgi:hypothetical protein
MAEARSNLAVMLVVLILTPCCFIGMHEIATAAQGQGGVIGQLIGQLKREDDEAEVKEIRESTPLSTEERKEARETAELAAFQSEQPTAGEEGEAG